MNTHTINIKQKILLFLLLSALMSISFFSQTYRTFQLDSERWVNSMLAAGIIGIDLSEADFGMNLLSCDGIVWDGMYANTLEQGGHDTMYLLWHSNDYGSRTVQIAGTRKQQIAPQGWFAYYLGLTYQWTHIPPKYYYYILRLMNAGLLALILTGISFELRKAYDIFFASCFYCACLVSVWIINFSPNLYWAAFTWFLPMLLGLVCMNNPSVRWYMYPLIALSVAVKSWCGYEYISTVMMCAIVFTLTEYLSSLGNDKLRAKTMFSLTWGIGLSALAGFAGAILFHAYVRGGGDVISGLSEIYHTDVLRRTFGSADGLPENLADDTLIREAVSASVIRTLARYLFKYEGWPALLMLLVSSASTITAKFRHNISVKRDVILLAVSFWSSISWFVLAKNHSYIHISMNYVLWYMPFIPAAMYVFLKQRLAVFMPDPEQRAALSEAVPAFIKRAIFLPCTTTR
ncbi:MAG: hypothetical protein II954_03935 [Synergistaceae bacterium]|nr:hypothetical protein [Synergistaceae bacterium]